MLPLMPTECVLVFDTALPVVLVRIWEDVWSFSVLQQLSLYKAIENNCRVVYITNER